MFVIHILWLATFAIAPVALAQTYPAKPVRVLLGTPSGAPPDVLGRIVVHKLAEALGQQFVVENRVGAGGTIATAAVAAAAPDGYTLTVASTMANAIGPALFPNAGYEGDKSFAPISLIGRAPFFLTVHPSMPASAKEFLEAVRGRPGRFNYGSAGSGSPPHVVMEMFKTATGLQLTHIPYKGNHYPGLLAGEIEATFDVPTLFAPHARAGKVRVLAIASAKRHPDYPDVPTMAEAGVPGFDVSAWYGLVAPRGTPRAIIERLHVATQKALAAPDVRAAFARLNTDVTGSTPAEFAEFLTSEAERWARAVKASGARIE